MEFKEYREEINRIFRRYTRNGFVDYRACNNLTWEMIDLMMDGQRELSARGEYKELFQLACKGFLKWGKTNKDDSDGGTQDFCYYVNEAWQTVYDANDKGISHKKMCQWFMSKLDGSVIDYMESYLYEFLVKHFMEPDLLQKKYDFYQEKIAEGEARADNYHYKHQAERCREYMLMLLADMGKPIEEIREYAKTLPKYSARERLAEIEKRYGNLDQVIAIYRELAEKEDRRGRARQNWHLKLKDLFQELGDQANYRLELKMALPLNVGNTDLWKEFRGFYSAEEWPEVREQYFSVFQPGYYPAYPWYAEEKRYDLIMEGIELWNDSSSLKHYEKFLKKEYPARCLAVLKESAVEMAEQSANRKEYRKVAWMLSWMEKYDQGDEVAHELAEMFRQKYPRRRAMMEEISRF